MCIRDSEGPLFVGEQGVGTLVGPEHLAECGSCHGVLSESYIRADGIADVYKRQHVGEMIFPLAKSTGRLAMAIVVPIWMYGIQMVKALSLIHISWETGCFPLPFRFRYI